MYGVTPKVAERGGYEELKIIHAFWFLITLCFYPSFMCGFFYLGSVAIMWGFLFMWMVWVFLLKSCWPVALASSSSCPHGFVRQRNREFLQKTDRFWEFEEQSNSWVEVKLPFDLVSCVGSNCTKVGSIHGRKKEEEERLGREFGGKEERGSLKKKDDHGEGSEEKLDTVLPLRKRLSLAKMSETSIWVTGESGAIYERFWNGLQWVVAPHSLPLSAGYAVSVFIINQTILALSESGNLYQMQLSENSHPIWVDFMSTSNDNTGKKTEQGSAIHVKSGVVSRDGVKVYFCTKTGSLLELSEIDPPRWVNHGRPPGADVAAIVDAANLRPDVVFTISCTGELYEYDGISKPSWKKHIWKEELAQDASLIPSKGATLQGQNGLHFFSLFLLTKSGDLVERRLHQRKWKWIVHGSPKGHHLTSVTPVFQDHLNEKAFSLFFTSSVGSVFEYQVSKHPGSTQENQIEETWVSHMHPLDAKVARGIAGLQFQVGRIMFVLDDGRLAELHLSGLGGESLGPAQANLRRKASVKYVWSILDAPETEGWNAEYCTEERGPLNCLSGIRDETSDVRASRSITRRRKGSQEQQIYLSLGASGSSRANSWEEYSYPDNWINANFRLRVMHSGRSFFLITDGGLTFEYLYAENVWLWLRHEHPTPMKGALGNYNGSLFLVDTHGSLLIRERSSSDLTWTNCSSMRRGRQVIAGPPWDGIPGRAVKATTEDALFFVSENGKLLQFTVALRKFMWKDCRHPPNTKIASIVDKEVFRENIVFVIGRDGRLYQYNKVTELWHEHYQSQHLVLSRLPGSAMRSSSVSLTGSLFMVSEDGGLVEYQWSAVDGWNWIEHGTPSKSVTLVGSPGPCFEGNQLFLIGSDGKVYLRHLDQTTWKWKNCGFPYMENMDAEKQEKIGRENSDEEICVDEDFAASLEEDENLDKHNINCNWKVASIRPIPFSEDSVIFELRDGRLAEMVRIEETQWEWSRIIGTPTSLCIANYWTAVAS